VLPLQSVMDCEKSSNVLGEDFCRSTQGEGEHMFNVLGERMLRCGANDDV